MEDADRGRYPRRAASQIPQFSLKALFGVTTGMACLFAFLTACGLDAGDIVLCFVSSAIAMVIGVMLVSLAWSGTGSPPHRPMSRCPRCEGFVRAGQRCYCDNQYPGLGDTSSRPGASPLAPSASPLSPNVSPLKIGGVNAIHLQFVSAGLLAVIALILLAFAASTASIFASALAVLALVLSLVVCSVRQVRGDIVVAFLALAPLVIAALAIGYFLLIS